MKSPVCGVCLRSGILCRKCMESVEKGRISQRDVDVSRMLMEMSGKSRALKDVTLVKTVESGDLMVLLCGRGDAAKFIGPSGSTVRKLENEIGKKVMIVEHSGRMEETASELVSPGRVSGKKKVYRNGEEIVRFVIEGRPRITQKDFGMIMELLYGKRAEMTKE